MKIEIWSDVMCPFCYIGKRRFETALDKFKYKDEVEIIWKSFQLNPQMKTDPGKSINQYLADIKDWPLEQAESMNERVTQMAKAEGLHYDFDNAIVANSFDAHRLIQFAKSHRKGAEAEERLFKAYFSEGKNTADLSTLTQLGTEIGLNKYELEKMLAGNEFAKEVQNDIREAQQLNINAVPFFVIDRKYGISGAQQTETFLEALNKSKEELK
jgi:predicted DsbA family dithiol-disulfide isomerase